MLQLRLLLTVFGLAALLACGRDETLAPRFPLTVTEPPTDLPPEQTMSPATVNYLLTMVTMMQANSINRLTIDWSALRSAVFEAARGAQTIDALMPAIRIAITTLADGHSFYRSATGMTISVPTRTCTATVALPFAMPATIGYVRVGRFSGSFDEAMAFATGIQDSIRSADHDSIAGWLVDLRLNSGGNMWPMIAGLGPIIGEDTIGHFISPIGTTTAWEYRNGASMLGGVPVITVPSPYELRRPRPRVAVLTDNYVASSGEATAIAFRARPDTRTFGFSTCGLSTANTTFRMIDGATLGLTTSTMADRTRRLYGGPLVPDEPAQNHADMVQRAIAWLQEGSSQ